MKRKEYPRVVWGHYEVQGGGKSVVQMRDIIKIVKKFDGTSVKNKYLVEGYNMQLQQLSDGAIGVRIWTDWDNSLRCTVVYPNSAVKEYMECMYFD